MATGNQIILAIETSGRIGSVALGRGEALLAQTEFSLVHNHARELLPAVDRLCRDCRVRPAEIGRIDVSIGPGSFTGLRVAVAFARHLSLACGARIIAVPTFDVVAMGVAKAFEGSANGGGTDDASARMESARGSGPPAHLAVMVDAKRGEVFAATYAFDATASQYQSVLPAHLTRPGVLLAESPRPTAVTGEGMSQHGAAAEAAGAVVLDERLWHPRAELLLRIGGRLAEAGRFTERRDLIPCYVRRPEAEEKWEALHGAAQ